MRPGRLVHVLFYISVIGKGVDGALEVLGGALLAVVDPARIHGLAATLTQRELDHAPHGVVGRYLLHTAEHLSPGAQSFAAIYLLWHGGVKAALVIALLLKRQWAYPAAIAAFGLFVAYQLQRYAHTHAPELLVLSAADVLLIVMTWLEYRRLRASAPVVKPDA